MEITKTTTSSTKISRGTIVTTTDMTTFTTSSNSKITGETPTNMTSPRTSSKFSYLRRTGAHVDLDSSRSYPGWLIQISSGGHKTERLGGVLGARVSSATARQGCVCECLSVCVYTH